MMNLLEKIPHDKLLHFLAGFLSTITLGYFLSWFTALWTGCLIGMTKEAYDAFTARGSLEAWDFVATATGSMFATGIILLSHLL